MKKFSTKGTVVGALLALSVPAMSAQVTLNIDAADRGAHIGDLQYGIFYEEINNAGDGGLYGELIRNRAFEDGNGGDYWTGIGSCSRSYITTGLLNENRSRALDLTLTGADQGLINTGYWGINCVEGDTYSLSFWLKSTAGYKGVATASLTDTQGNVGATTTVDIDADGEWHKYTAKMTATKTISKSQFRLVFNKAGRVQLDMVSLFPPTYKDRENGCRRDLAEMLAAMKPAFVRFPGGCYIEGDGTVDDNRRFEWKKTIGPIEERPGHYNFNWGYPSTDGLGFHEFLQLTEDLGAEPLFVVNIGIGHGWYTDYTKIDDYIQEALDALEYCNGDVNTTWGAKRAANGHPEPFNMRLLEIGNENYNFDDDRSDHYAERYKAFYDAIKARFPEVTLIGNVEAWGTDTPSWRNSFPCEIVDEHYYRWPSWFAQCYNKYDSYDRSGPKVYVGEYAVTNDFGTVGNLNAALGEAVYMLGMERNSDHVIMSSYAPIFMNEERDGGWMPDMIRFSHDQSYGTPSYWVQQLLPNNHGKQNVNWTEAGNLNGGTRVALSSWSTRVKYDNVKITDANGNVLFSDDFSTADSQSWKAPNSNWTRTGGALVQNSASEQGKLYAGTFDLPGSYTFELDAVKVSGAEGFLVAFNYGDDNNYCWWNIGGWNNGQHGLQVCTNGAKSDYDLKSGSIETGRTYHLRLVVNGSHVQCYLDDALIHDMQLPVDRRVYTAASIDDETGTMYVKIVNTGSEAYDVTLNMANASINGATVTVLTSASATDENTKDNPTNVVPADGSMKSVEAHKAVYNAPAYSLSIIKLSLSDVKYDGDSALPPTDEQVEALKEELYPTICKLSWLHASTTLPMNTSSGATIEWNFKEPAAGATISSSRYMTQLELTRPNNSNTKQLIATLTATVTYPDGHRGDIDFEVWQAPADGMYGYLYAFMNPASEITNYALGEKETFGKRFEVLIDGGEVFDTNAMAPVEGGTRDAFLGRGQRPDEYFMTVTDMSNIKTGKWNNHALALLRSTDLIHWETASFDFNLGKSIFSDPTATTDGYKTDAEYAKIDRVWAPQFIWVPDGGLDGAGAYFVYYSLLSSNPGDNHDRMFYSWADKDFKTLTQPRLFYDPGYAVIDADITYSEHDHLYHMMIKKEGAKPEDTGIYGYTSPTLLGSPWTEILHMSSEGTAAVEGPTLLRRIDEDVYNLYFMRYDAEYTYKVVDLDHLTTKYSSSTRLAGSGNFQHGSVIPVDETEYNMLSTWSDLVKMLAKCKRIQAGSDTHVFDRPIADAETALESNLTVQSLAEALPVALKALLEAHGEYLASESNDFNDITSQLTNPDFNGNNGTGWTGSSFTATASGVAEQWNKIFDTYQVLKNMPAGTYRLELQGFYRYGYQAESRAAHNNGTEELLAHYYMNDSEGTFMSLYAETLSTTPDNVSQSNAAFNTLDKYHNDPITCVLDEMGDLRIGVRKTKAINGDWTCFDNFKLYFKPASAGVDNVLADGENDGPVDVYNIAGMLLKSGVDRSEATRGLAPGVYLVGNEKVTVR